MSDKEFITGRLQKIAGRALKTDLDLWQAQQELDQLVDEMPGALEVLGDALFEGELELDELKTARNFGLLQLLEWLRDRKLGPQVSSELLVSYLDHSTDPIRDCAIDLLVSQGSDALQAAAPRLKVNSARTQVAAAEVLRKLGAVEAIEALEAQLAREKSGMVRAALEEALAKLRQEAPHPGPLTGEEGESAPPPPTAEVREEEPAYGSDEPAEDPHPDPLPGGKGEIPHRPPWLPPAKAASFGGIRLDEVRVEPDGSTLWPGQRGEVAFELTQIEGWLLEILGRFAFRIVRTEALAWAVNLSPDEVHVHMTSLREKLEEDPARPKHLFVAHGMGYRFEVLDQVFTTMTTPPAIEIDWLVEARETSSLDELLAKMGEVLQAGGPKPPVVRWIKGEPLSEGALAWVVAHTLARDPAIKLVRPALNDEECGALAIWLILRPSDRRDLRGIEILSNDELTHEVARLFEERTLRLWQLRGFTRPMTPAVLRWSHSWRRTRNAPSIRTMFRPGVHTLPIESAWPSGDDPSGTADEWRGWMVEVLEDAMAAQYTWRGLELRQAFIQNPLARQACRGVIFAVKAGDDWKPFLIEPEKITDMEGGEIELGIDDLIRVMHPIVGLAKLARGRSHPPFPQADRPLFTQKDLPEVPFLKAVPEKTWLWRLREWRFENGEPENATDPSKPNFRVIFEDFKDFGDYRLEIHHSGSGSDQPVTFTMALARFKGNPIEWEEVPQPILSEMILDLLRLFDLLPQIRRKDPEETPDLRRPEADLLEQAPSGRSKCRRCNEPIDKGGWRFGAGNLNPFSKRGRTSHQWYHPDCAAIVMPKELCSCLERTPDYPDREAMIDRLTPKPKPQPKKAKPQPSKKPKNVEPPEAEAEPEEPPAKPIKPAKKPKKKPKAPAGEQFDLFSGLDEGEE